MEPELGVPWPGAAVSVPGSVGGIRRAARLVGRCDRGLAVLRIRERAVDSLAGINVQRRSVAVVRDAGVAHSREFATLDD